MPLSLWRRIRKYSARAVRKLECLNPGLCRPMATTKVVLGAFERALEHWHRTHREEYSGWNINRTSFVHPSGNRVLLVNAGISNAAEGLRGMWIDEIEITGPLTEAVHNLHAEACPLSTTKGVNRWKTSSKTSRRLSN